MKNDWNSLESAAEKGPVSLGLKLILIIAILAAAIGGVGFVFGWFSEGARVVQEQFGPKAVLEKYEWFKNAAAQLDAFTATIEANKARITAIEGTYVDENNKAIPRSKWARSDIEAYNQVLTEIAGIKGAYNNLAGEYNAAMAKVNFRFANQGDLPAGASQVLPCSFRPYIN